MRVDQDMSQPRQTKVHALAAVSLLLSISMLGIALTRIDLPIWPVILANWIAFMATTMAIGHRIGVTNRSMVVSKGNHNLWRLVILAFSGCGFAAIAVGAKIV